MTSKLLLIIRREYLAKVRNKSFIIMTILSPLLIVGMIALIVFLTKVNSNEKKIIAVLDENLQFSEQFTTTPEASFIQLHNLTVSQAKDSVVQAGYYGLLHIPSMVKVENTLSNVTFYSKKSPSMTVLSGVERKMEKKIREEKLKTHGLSASDLEKLNQNFEINISGFSGEKNVKGVNEMKAFVGGGMGYLIMMFIIIYGAFVMRSVIEEKTSRIIEVIISSVKPFQLMLGKILGTSLAGITQFIIWIVSASVLSLAVFAVMGVDMQSLHATTLPSEAADAIKIASTSSDKITQYAVEFFKIPWGMLIFFFIIYFTLGYLIYSSIYAAIGAAVDNETDTQQFMFPVIMPMMLAIYVGFFSVFENPHGPIAVGFSLFPLTSPIVMLMRLPAGIGTDGVPLWQLIVSLVLLIGTFIFIVWLAAKIYRVGILMYGKKPTYKELYKWLKY